MQTKQTMKKEKEYGQNPTEQKKQALQARSKQTVKNILEAARLVIEQEGLYGLTTNKIAERAGVNIASLYQYFSNKEAIVNTLVNSIFQKESERISQAILALMTKPSIRGASEEVIALAIDIFRKNEVFLKQILQTDEGELYFSNNNEFAELFTRSGETFLKERQEELRVKNVHHALYILQNSVIPLLLTYLINPKVGIHDHEMVLEVSDLIGCYLLK